MLKSYKFWLILIIGGLLIYFFIIKPNISLYEANKENETLKKEILAKDTLQKLDSGKYSKLVNNFNSASDLNKLLKDSMNLISDTIKNRKERILFVDKNNITFTGKKDSSQLILTKTGIDSTYSFTSFYPKTNNYFIKYDANINLKNKIINDNWTFSNINLNVVVTERKDGLWDSYIDGPTFLKVNSVQVNSLPAAKFVPASEQTKLFALYGGLGVRGNIDGNINNKVLLLKGALTIKDNLMIQLDYGTDNKVGTGVLLKF